MRDNKKFTIFVSFVLGLTIGASFMAGYYSRPRTAWGVVDRYLQDSDALRGNMQKAIPSFNDVLNQRP